MQLPEDASDDDLYRWFVRSLASNGSATEVRPGVIRVELSWSPSGEDVVPGSDEQVVWVHLTRSQLRSVAPEEHDVFDDTDLHVVPRTDTPVWQGLVAFDFSTEETIATLRPGEHHLVFHDGSLCASTTPGVPPVRSNHFW